jgi:hypothetical protein
LAREAEVRTTGPRRRLESKKTDDAVKDDVIEIKVDEVANPDVVEDIVNPDIIDDIDPLTGLVERTKEDAGAPFAPEILAALSELKKRDKRAFEALRSQLKRVGCRIGSLDESLSEEISGGPGARTQTGADILLRLV